MARNGNTRAELPKKLKQITFLTMHRGATTDHQFGNRSKPNFKRPHKHDRGSERAERIRQQRLRQEKERRDREAIMRKRTKRGQPVMKGRIELLLKQIERKVDKS